MQRWRAALGMLMWLLLCPGQGVGGPAASAQEPTAAVVPPPDPTALLRDVERNQKHLEDLQRDYTYHVHTDQQELDKHGNVSKTETIEAESLTVDGVRVDRVTARNGHPLTAEEQRKEDERIDKTVASARERRSRLEAKGESTDDRGDQIIPLSRILELGSFSHLRREVRDGRTVDVLDYAGNPQAKTHSALEGILRDVVGTVTVDEQDRVLVAAQGRFLNDFKLGAGLLADVRKGTSFSFSTTRVADGVWLPAVIAGEGTVRLLLFAHFSGRLHVVTSDYRRFRTSTTILGSHGAIGPDGTPLPVGQDKSETPVLPNKGARSKDAPMPQASPHE